MPTTQTQVKSDLREMYDRLATEYSTAYDSAAGQYFMRRKIETLLALGSFGVESHLVEVGCADGAYTLELGKRGYQITGLDLSSECIRVAGERAQQAGLSQLRFATTDAESLTQFADSTFDGAFSLSTLRYVPDPGKAIQEIYRVIKPGAVAVVDFPNKQSPWFTFLKPLLTHQTHIHDHQYTTAQVAAMMEAAGFRDITPRRILYTPKTIPDWFLPVMKAADFVGERTPGLKQLASIIMVGGRK